MMIYLSGPVFTLAERRFNEELAGELERLYASLHILLPQRYDREFQNEPDFSQRMFACLTGALENCKVVVAILDGPDADSGTCFEIGYARGRGRRVIGVRTDFRSSKNHGLNLMLLNGCSDLVTEPSTTATSERLAERIASVWLRTNPLPHDEQAGIRCCPDLRDSGRPRALSFAFRHAIIISLATVSSRT